MHHIEGTMAQRLRAVTPAPARCVYVDCADAARQDLLVLWLTRAGYEVCEAAPAADEAQRAQRGDLLLTDRFGPGLAGEIVIAETKASHPGLRVVVLGCGGAGQAAQLSLARVAGADATLASPIDRRALLELLRNA